MEDALTFGKLEDKHHISGHTNKNLFVLTAVTKLCQAQIKLS